MFENSLDLVWVIAAALAAVFGLAGSVLAVYAVRRRRPVLGAVFGVLAIVVFGVLAVAAGFMAIGLLLLDSGMDELTPADGSAGRLGIIAGRLCSLGSVPLLKPIDRPRVDRVAAPLAPLLDRPPTRVTLLLDRPVHSRAAFSLPTAAAGASGLDSCLPVPILLGMLRSKRGRLRTLDVPLPRVTVRCTISPTATSSPPMCAANLIEVVNGYIGRCDEDAARAGIEWMRERYREAGQTPRF